MGNQNTAVDEYRLAKALRDILGGTIQCEWDGPDCLLFGATTTAVYDPERNIVTLDLCLNCLKDHDVA
jgi:hypothetical protein